MKLEDINLKKHPAYNEKWVQDQIAEDPSILGLGDLILRDKERTQTSGGRLDLLLQDPETLKRYEVELQLGSVDESHIIRTVEYWDIERKRYPQYEHAAVIVAEEITSRFLNVIQLFNGSIPLIALKMSAYKYDDKVFLKFVKVVDERSYGFVDEDEPIAEQVDREYWEKKRPKKILEITDEFINLIKQADVNSVPKYNKYYIGFTANGTPSTSINAKPRVNSVIVQIKLLKDEEIDNIIEVSGMDLLTYETKYSQYRIRLNSKITEKQKEVLLNLIKQSRQLTEK